MLIVGPADRGCEDLDPTARDTLRRVLIREQAERDAISCTCSATAASEATIGRHHRHADAGPDARRRVVRMLAEIEAGDDDLPRRVTILVHAQARSHDRHPLETLLALIEGPLHADEGGVEAPNIPEERPSISARSPDTQDERKQPAYETTLVASAANGDAGAFEELYRTHVGGVARHVRLRLGKADEDAVAEVFVRAWAGISSYRELGRPFGAWLFGIARHVIADEFRARSRTIPVAEPPERAVEPMTTELLALREAIDRLPEDQRHVIELRYLAGLSNDEVAAAMGTSPSAVNTKRWRALLVLRDVLKDAP